MKKLFLSVCLIIVVSFTFAQKTNVSKAESFLALENPDYKGAREAIKLAMQDPSTKDDAKTYYTAGLIGEKENHDLFEKIMIGMKVDTTQLVESAKSVFKYYLIADSLDKLPDEKGKVKPRYTKKIKTSLSAYYTGIEPKLLKGKWTLFNEAGFFYNKGNEGETPNIKYNQIALDLFKLYMSIPTLSLLSEDKLPIDNVAKYYAAISARSSDNHKCAIKFFNDIKNDTIRTNYVYQSLAKEYINQKDTVNFLKTIDEGFNKFKGDSWYLDTKINYYIFSDKLNEAVKYLDDAIAQSPDTAQYYVIRGNILDKLEKFDKAKADFETALKLKSTNPSAHMGLGRLIFNQGVIVLNNAINIKDNKAYKVEKDKADKLFNEALPYLQKAVALNPNDMDYKSALKQLYYRLDMQKEYDEITKEMKQ